MSEYIRYGNTLTEAGPGFSAEEIRHMEHEMAKDGHYIPDPVPNNNLTLWQRISNWLWIFRLTRLK